MEKVDFEIDHMNWQGRDGKIPFVTANVGETVARASIGITEVKVPMFNEAGGQDYRKVVGDYKSSLGDLPA